MKLVKPTHFSSHFDLALMLANAIKERGMRSHMSSIESYRFSECRNTDLLHELRDQFRLDFDRVYYYVAPSSVLNFNGPVKWYKSLLDVIAELGEELIQPRPFAGKLDMEALLQLMRATNVLCMADINCGTIQPEEYLAYKGNNGSRDTLSIAITNAVSRTRCIDNGGSDRRCYNSFCRASCDESPVYYDVFINQCARMRAFLSEKCLGNFKMFIAPKQECYGSKYPINEFMPIGIIQQPELTPYSTDSCKPGEFYALDLMSSGPDISSWVYDQSLSPGEIKYWGYYPVAIADFRCDDGFTFFDLS